MTVGYGHDEIVAALRDVGVGRGDIVFSHVGMGFLGPPREPLSPTAAADQIVDAFLEVLGSSGTLLVPTFSYSFCSGRDYDALTTPSTTGAFTEVFRKRPGVVRSREPNFSVAGLGPACEALFRDLPMDSFGAGCLYDRLRSADAALCNVGVGFRYATYVHHVERQIGVPYRFEKEFSGYIVENGTRTFEKTVYYVRTTADDQDSLPDLSRLEEDVRRAGTLKEIPLGRSIITRISCKDFTDAATAGIRRHPWYLARGYATRSSSR